jgi:putative alpha-1,2-mannosidase
MEDPEASLHCAEERIGDYRLRFAARSRLLLFSFSLVSLLNSSFGQVRPVAEKSASTNHVADVYPFLGVDWGGNTFVGAALPFGMVKLGPDMVLAT